MPSHFIGKQTKPQSSTRQTDVSGNVEHSDPSTTASSSSHGDQPTPSHTANSNGAVGSMSGRNNKSNSNSNSNIQHLTPSRASPSPNATPKMGHTIRTVPSFDAPSDTSSCDTPSRNSAFSSSVNSNASGISMSSNQDKSPSVRLRPKQDRNGSGSENGDQTLRAADVSTISKTSGTGRTGGTGGESITHAAEAADDQNVAGTIVSPEVQGQGWDSTIGKAGLGKTGRVINKLVSDNDSLKRDIRIERLRAEEAKQAAKLVEDKMERLVSEYESRLLEANVTKTLLSRKERQVETLTATVEQEKKRAADALERERGWLGEMEKMRRSTSRQVDEAATHAALMEGRYNAISSHWRDQGDEAKRAHLKMREDIAGLVEERSRDDEKIATLRDLCDQQDGNVRELRRQRDDVRDKFEEYKRQQEDALAGIKSGAAEREAEQQRMLGEARDVLHKLKWALNVKENVEGAG